MTRAEHIAWCKERALKYVELGDFQQGFSSMISDLGKHEETKNHPGIMLGAQMLFSGFLSDEGEMRKFIKGFN